LRLHRGRANDARPDDLETERQHVGRKPGDDDFGGVDALVAEMREAFLKAGADGAGEPGGKLATVAS